MAQQSPFENLNQYVEKIFYLSESVLLVVTRQMEFKLFYTQNFTDGVYSQEKSSRAGLCDLDQQRRQALCQIDGDMFANGVS